MPMLRRQYFSLTILWLFLCTPAMAAGLRPPASAVATAHPLATEAGLSVLKQGGNAFDAAVAIAAALAVVEPAGSGLGGGGFWLLQRANGKSIVVDGRERAPLAATADMYLDKHAKPASRLSLDGAKAAAIPGTPAALVHVAKHYGKLPLSQSLGPARHLAAEGFKVSERYREMLAWRQAAMAANPSSAVIFLEDGQVPRADFILRQPDLAVSLERLAEHGHDGFYRGELAASLVRGARAAGGIWQLRDLHEYAVVERKPVRGNYHGMAITTVPPPSSGGVVLMQILNILEHYPLEKLDRVARDHLIIEAMRLAYRDRARYLGDPDFVSMDVSRLLSRSYARRLRREIRPQAWAGSAQAESQAIQGAQTTHFSVIDREGNRAAVTLSLNTAFGSAYVPPGTGILLNNEMDDFALAPGVPNAYGLVGSQANAIAPGKRPLSSMTPTILETPDAVVILGTPGGSRIISMVLLAALEFAHGRGDVQRWVAQPRFHHQYLPDQVDHEPGSFTLEELEQLQALGHQFKEIKPGYGNMQAVVWYKKTALVEAASDPRGEGAVHVYTE